VILLYTKWRLKAMGWVIKDLGKVISFLLNLLGYGDKLNYFHNGCFVFYGKRKITVELFLKISFTVGKNRRKFKSKSI
jgi:hypothetical protein